MNQPVYLLAPNAERSQGKHTQFSSIQAAIAVSTTIRTTLGPNSMLKMMLDPLGGVVLTNDGNAILREINANHPAARILIDLSKSQDEEIGDGTTSVVILTGEILRITYNLLEKNIHANMIIKGFYLALSKGLELLDSISEKIDISKEDQIKDVLISCLKTKFSKKVGEHLATLALEAVNIVARKNANGKIFSDTKRYVKIEKINGGTIEDSLVVRGLAMQKDVTHSRMRRKIINPRVVLLNCPLEYKKGESMTTLELTNEDDIEKALLEEENEIKRMTDAIINAGCDLVITEKGVSDLAAHFLMKAGISVIRRTKKTEQIRIALVTGAGVVNACEDIKPEDIGRECCLFEIKKIGDNYWTFLTNNTNPKACSIILRGGSKDSLNEIERNLHDALATAKNIVSESRMLAGGGACDIELSQKLFDYSETISGNARWGCQAVAEALLIIPKILIENSGKPVHKKLSELQKLHSSNSNNCNLGINGLTGEICDTIRSGIIDTYAVKSQILKTAIECSSMLIKVDDLLSGIKKEDK